MMKKLQSLMKILPLFILGFLLTACSPADNEVAANIENDRNTDPIRIIFYPNESGSELEAVRDEMERLIEEATGRSAEAVTTIDYNVAIESIISGQAHLAFMGPDGYVQANNRNENVQAIMTSSGESGTLEDALYYSFIAVREEDAHIFEDGDGFTLEPLEGTVFSFVSNVSTSGFVVPGGTLLDEFSLDSLDDLVKDDSLFDRVLFGGSHQVSAVNLLRGEADAAAFMNMEAHFEAVGGEENKAGMIYQVRADAEAPFDTVRGERAVIISSTAVLNAPFVANMDVLTEEEIENIIEVFTSDEVANNELFFSDRDSDVVSLFTINSGEGRLLRVTDEWYDPVRELAR